MICSTIHLSYFEVVCTYIKVLFRLMRLSTGKRYWRGELFKSHGSLRSNSECLCSLISNVSRKLSLIGDVLSINALRNLNLFFLQRNSYYAPVSLIWKIHLFIQKMFWGTNHMLICIPQVFQPFRFFSSHF